MAAALPRGPADAVEQADLILVGAGPSNIALAVAMEEHGLPPGVERVVMLEAGDSVAWHPGMMFSEAQSQVSFLKDLVTLRDPTSRFTFLNFLHRTGRLQEFVDLQTFFPYRREISAYLRWCVEGLSRVQLRCSSAVQQLRPVADAQGRVGQWRLRCRDGRVLYAPRVVYGAGRDALVPEAFAGLSSARLLHASRFLGRAATLDPAGISAVAVIGGAQSSAEVYSDCLQRFPKARVRMLMRSVGLTPYGGSKFTNALYGEDYVDRFFSAPPARRRVLLESMHDSNYAGVTPTMLESLYRFHYLQRLDGTERARIHTQCRIGQVHEEGGRIHIGWDSGAGADRHDEAFDLVVLGTGYRNATPALLHDALRELPCRELAVDRNYRAVLASADGVSLHTLGINEATHGISDTLLSVVGARARRVLDDIAGDRRPGPPPAQTFTRAPSPAPTDSAALVD